MSRHWRLIWWLLGALAIGGTAPAQTNWTLVWADEFAQPDGSSPDPGKWAFDVGGGGWGNNEWQYYSTTNATVTNGLLVIEARQRVAGATTNYTSARLKTQGKASWAYGRFEARIQLPRGQGLWPAFWMLGTNITTPGNGWPNCGEIDLMENIGREPTLIHGTVHGPGYSGGNAVSAAYALPGNPIFADGFHIFAMEWTTNRIEWFVDGQSYFVVTPASLPGGATWVFTQPQFLLLNVAVGGNWPGDPDASTSFPQRMLVDYVRVYRAGDTNSPPAVSGTLTNGGFETGSLAPWIGEGFCCANPAGGNITSTNDLVWDPGLNAANNQGIRNPAIGAHACKLFGNFSGAPNAPGFYQDVAARPGSLWFASIQARTQSPDYLRPDNHAVAGVSFLDALGGVLAKYTSPVFAANQPTNTWVTLDVTQQILPVIGNTNRLSAPPGTVKARFAVTFSQTLYEPGSVYFDDAELAEIILEPPTLAAAPADGGKLQLSFPTRPHVNYQVLVKSQLNDPDWTALETVPGDGSVKSLLYPASGPTRFYTVRVF